MGRRSETRITTLIRDHSPYTSITELGRAIGDPQLAHKLRYARQRHQLPDGRTLSKLAERLDLTGRGLLVDALAWDGQLPGYDLELIPVQRELSRIIRSMSGERRRALLVFLGVDDPELIRAVEREDPFPLGQVEPPPLEDSETPDG